jgi:hypothetical protein
MLRNRNMLFRLRMRPSLRESGVVRKPLAGVRSFCGVQIVKEQWVTQCAKRRGSGAHLGFARHMTRVPSKSTERYTPYSLTRTSTGSVMR